MLQIANPEPRLVRDLVQRGLSVEPAWLGACPAVISCLHLMFPRSHASTRAVRACGPLLEPRA